jgi:hypothetical protein
LVGSLVHWVALIVVDGALRRRVSVVVGVGSRRVPYWLAIIIWIYKNELGLGDIFGFIVFIGGIEYP